MEEHDGEPRARWRLRRFFVRAAVFVLLATVAEVLASLPPGPHDRGSYVASAVVLALCALCVLLPGERMSRWVVLGPTLTYLVSVTLLLCAGGSDPTFGSTTGGLSVLVLLPVLAMALYYPIAYSGIVIVASVVSLAVADVETRATPTVDLLRVALWSAIAVMMAMTIHRLRRNLEGEVRDSAESVRVGRLMHRATQSLTVTRDPERVIAEGTRILSDLAGLDVSRTSYVRIDEGVVSETAVVDAFGQGSTGWLERDDPYLGQVIACRASMVAALEPSAMGPTLRSMVDEIGVRHVGLVPVAPSGRLDGVLVVSSRDAAISDDVFSRCRAFGNVVEMAMENALAHHELEAQANSDPLTGLANRRGLAQYLQGGTRAHAVAVLMLDVDGMKSINDAHGHDVGDAVLVAVARVAASRLRECDLLARTGGDEFVAVLRDADETDARRVVARLTQAISGMAERGVPASVSIGYACCPPYGDIEDALQRADDSMYDAKRPGRRHLRQRRRGHPGPPAAMADSSEDSQGEAVARTIGG